MTGDDRTRPLAVLDTSFWVAGCWADVAANSLDLFRIVVPAAVEVEIRATLADQPQREYAYATLFRHLRDKMLDPPGGFVKRIDGYGPGEAEAISLARDLGALVLINERPGIALALSLGLHVVTVPALVVAVCAAGVVSERAARRRLDLIERVTSPQIIAQARAALDALATIPAEERAADT